MTFAPRYDFVCDVRAANHVLRINAGIGVCVSAAAWTAASSPSVESDDGTRFFGAVRFDADLLGSVYALMSAEQGAILTTESQQGGTIARQLVHSGWAAHNTRHPQEILQLVGHQSALVIQTYGEFDDQDIKNTSDKSRNSPRSAYCCIREPMVHPDKTTNRHTPNNLASSEKSRDPRQQTWRHSSFVIRASSSSSVSIHSVTGPSFTSDTSICARNRPVATSTPCPAACATKLS
jgi:hypothetical protein